MSYHFLLDLALILFSTKVLGILTKRIQMPQVVGALVAGLILGPAVLDVLTETEFLTQLSELGVIVLMFSAGMGTDIQELKHSGKAGFLVALLGVIVPLILGTGLAMAAGRAGMIATTGFLEDVFIGTILTATSVSITVETLKEIGKLDTKVGNTILAAALIDDVLGLIALTIVSSVAGGQDSIVLVLVKIVLFFLFAGVASFFALKFFRWLMALDRGRERRRYPVLAFVLCLAMAYCAEEFFGVADITGAYIAGMILSPTKPKEYIDHRAETTMNVFFVPIFFASVALKMYDATMDFTDGLFLTFGFLYVFAGLLGKFLGAGAASLACRFSLRDSLAIGTGMMARAEVLVVTAQTGVDSSLVSPGIMPFTLLLILVSSFLTPLLLRLIYGKNASGKGGNETSSQEAPSLAKDGKESALDREAFAVL